MLLYIINSVEVAKNPKKLNLNISFNFKFISNHIISKGITYGYNIFLDILICMSIWNIVFANILTNI